MDLARESTARTTAARRQTKAPARKISDYGTSRGLDKSVSRAMAHKSAWKLPVPRNFARPWLCRSRLSLPSPLQRRISPPASEMVHSPSPNGSHHGGDSHRDNRKMDGEQTFHRPPGLVMSANPISFGRRPRSVPKRATSAPPRATSLSSAPIATPTSAPPRAGASFTPVSGRLPLAVAQKRCYTPRYE